MSTIDVTNANFEAEVTNSDKPVLIDFWAPWCGPCKAMNPVIKQVAEGRRDIKIVKINTEENQELGERFNICGIPAFVLMNGGKIVGSTSGAQSAGSLNKWIDQTLLTAPADYIDIAQKAELDAKQQSEEDEQNQKDLKAVTQKFEKFLYASSLTSCALQIAGGLMLAATAPAGLSVLGLGVAAWNTNRILNRIFFEAANETLPLRAASNTASLATGFYLCNMAAAPYASVLIGAFMMARGGAGLIANIAQKPMEWYAKSLIEKHIKDDSKPEKEVSGATAAAPSSPQP